MHEEADEFLDLCRLYLGEPGPYPRLSSARLFAVAAELQQESLEEDAQAAHCWNLLLDEIVWRFQGRERFGRVIVTMPGGLTHMFARRGARASAPRIRAR